MLQYPARKCIQLPGTLLEKQSRRAIEHRHKNLLFYEISKDVFNILLSTPERIIHLGDCFSEGYLAAVDGVQQREDAENPQQQPQQPSCGWHLPQVRVDTLVNFCNMKELNCIELCAGPWACAWMTLLSSSSATRLWRTSPSEEEEQDQEVER